MKEINFGRIAAIAIAVVVLALLALVAAPAFACGTGWGGGGGGGGWGGGSCECSCRLVVKVERCMSIDQNQNCLTWAPLDGAWVQLFVKETPPAYGSVAGWTFMGSGATGSEPGSASGEFEWGLAPAPSNSVRYDVCIRTDTLLSPAHVGGTSDPRVRVVYAPSVSQQEAFSTDAYCYEFVPPSRCDGGDRWVVRFKVLLFE